MSSGFSLNQTSLAVLLSQGPPQSVRKLALNPQHPESCQQVSHSSPAFTATAAPLRCESHSSRVKSLSLASPPPGQLHHCLDPSCRGWRVTLHSNQEGVSHCKKIKTKPEKQTAGCAVCLYTSMCLGQNKAKGTLNHGLPEP